MYFYSNGFLKIIYLKGIKTMKLKLCNSDLGNKINKIRELRIFRNNHSSALKHNLPVKMAPILIAVGKALTILADIAENTKHPRMKVILVSNFVFTTTSKTPIAITKHHISPF